VIALLAEPDFLWPLAWTTIFATVLALSLMNVFQREIDPVRAAILYAFEPIWATFAALFAGMDQLTPWLWVGGSALLAGNLVAELGGRKQTSAPA
jgi:drug/metabolite transporter (DMT)-like permease